jgi:hypothetical protein
VGDLVVLEVVPTEIEANLICAILRDAGIECFHRPTNQSVGAGDGWALAGPREIVVHAEDAKNARGALELQRDSR